MSEKEMNLRWNIRCRLCKRKGCHWSKIPKYDKYGDKYCTGYISRFRK